MLAAPHDFDLVDKGFSDINKQWGSFVEKQTTEIKDHAKLIRFFF